MNKIRKILTELRNEYLKKRACLVGSRKPDMNPEVISKIDFKVKMYTDKIDEINDAMVLESDNE